MPPADIPSPNAKPAGVRPLWNSALSSLRPPHVGMFSIGIFVFSWLERWQPSWFPWGRTNFFSDMWVSLWLQMEGVDCICLGAASLSLTYQLKRPKHLPAAFILPLFPTVFFFLKVKHRSFCFMSHQLSGFPPSPPTTNWSKWKGIRLLEWDWPRRPTPVGSAGALCRGDSMSFCNLATLPGRSFKGWGSRDVFISGLLFFFTQVWSCLLLFDQITTITNTCYGTWQFTNFFLFILSFNSYNHLMVVSFGHNFRD